MNARPSTFPVLAPSSVRVGLVAVVSAKERGGRSEMFTGGPRGRSFLRQRPREKYTENVYFSCGQIVI